MAKCDNNDDNNNDTNTNNNTTSTYLYQREKDINL